MAAKYSISILVFLFRSQSEKGRPLRKKSTALPKAKPLDYVISLDDRYVVSSLRRHRHMKWPELRRPIQPAQNLVEVLEDLPGVGGAALWSRQQAGAQQRANGSR